MARNGVPIARSTHSPRFSSSAPKETGLDAAQEASWRSSRLSRQQTTGSLEAQHLEQAAPSPPRTCHVKPFGRLTAPDRLDTTHRRPGLMLWAGRDRCASHVSSHGQYELKSKFGAVPSGVECPRDLAVFP